MSSDNVCPVMLRMLCMAISMIAASSISGVAKVPHLPDGWVMTSQDADTKTRVFQSQDGQATLTTHQSKTSRDLSRDMDAIAHHDGERVTYQSRGSSWIAVSGYRGDQIFYRKSNLACGGKRWHNIEFTYPIADKRRMDSAVTTMARAMTHYGNDC